MTNFSRNPTFFGIGLRLVLYVVTKTHQILSVIHSLASELRESYQPVVSERLTFWLLGTPSRRWRNHNVLGVRARVRNAELKNGLTISNVGKARSDDSNPPLTVVDFG